MSSNFITNKERFLSDIINGILPKTDAVYMLIGYFYYSGYIQLSERLKDKQIQIHFTKCDQRRILHTVCSSL